MPHNGGKALLNLAVAPYDCFWALNALKMQGDSFVPHTSAGVLITDENWYPKLNAHGYPTAMPDAVGSRWASNQLYLYKEDAADTVWVLDWEGDATLSLTESIAGITATNTASSTNREEYTFTGTFSKSRYGKSAFLVSLRITAIPTSVSNIRLYRKDHEALINGSGVTSKFAPDFLASLHGVGALRFMDLMSANSNSGELWAARKVEDAFSWIGAYVNPAYYHGVATKTLNRYTVPDSMGTLVHTQPVTFKCPAAPTRLTVSSVVKGSPTRINFSAAHGLTTGDKVTANRAESGGGSWAVSGLKQTGVGTGVPKIYTATVIDTDTIDIDLDSTSFEDYTGTFSLFPAIEISDGVTTKQCWSQYLNCHYSSEFGGWANSSVTATYDAAFDCFIVAGGSTTGNVGGMPLEVALELCVYIGAHPFLCLPHLTATVDGSYATSYSTVVKNALAGTGLIAHYEHSNEVWNTGGGFSQTYYAASNATRLYGSASVNRDYARATIVVSNAIDAVYGVGGTDDWRMCAGVQNGSYTGFEARFTGDASVHGGNPDNYASKKWDIVLTASYIQPAFSGEASANTYTGWSTALSNYTAGGASRTAAFEWFRDEMYTASDAAWVAIHGQGEPLDLLLAIIDIWLTNISSYPGRRGALQLGHYEGFNHISGANAIDGGFSAGDITVIQEFFPAYLESDQHAEVMTTYLQDMYDAGVYLPSLFKNAEAWSLGLNFGADSSNDFDAPETPAFTAFRDWSDGAPPGYARWQVATS